MIPATARTDGQVDPLGDPALSVSRPTPQVFIKGDRIGGSDELAAYLAG